MRMPTRREALLGGLVISLIGLSLLPQENTVTQAEVFRALVGRHAPDSGVDSWEEIASAFFGYDGEAATICQSLASLRMVPSGDSLACLLQMEPRIEALEAIRRRAIEFFVLGTDLLDPARPLKEPVRFIAVPDPMSGAFCNPVARFDEGVERVMSDGPEVQNRL